MDTASCTSTLTLAAHVDGEAVVVSAEGNEIFLERTVGVGRIPADVAKQFGVSEATVSYVVNGGRWGKLTGGKKT